ILRAVTGCGASRAHRHPPQNALHHHLVPNHANHLALVQHPAHHDRALQKEAVRAARDHQHCAPLPR
ncbi:hypothetical protein IWQ57_007027, partial [Coemansia nantahalensis]